MSHEPYFLRQTSAALAGFGIANFLSRTSRAEARKLLVYLHVAMKQRAFQGELQASLPSAAVTAVGRLADFERGLRDGTDAVLSLPVLLAARGFSVRLQGRRQGVPHETYSLVGADTPPDPNRVRVVGALDLLGRDGTTAFVHRLVGASPKVERVTKLEDLLPLLQMRRAEAVLIPTRLIADLRSASRLNLVQRGLATPVGLPALAVTGPGGADVMAAVSALPGKLCRMIGVDAWR
ncbi:MAG TPA: hypothetical protein VKY73_05130 [Polyangiaceae bacterium]|nr:hypothetical protein [Polyangiaceae bacterium]